MAAENIGRNLEEEEEFQKIQKQIGKNIKEQVTGYKELGGYTKNILENYADIQKMSVKIKQTEKEIAALLKEGSNESKIRAAYLQQEVEELKKQRDQYRAINKEMHSIKNSTKAVLNSTLGFLKQSAIAFLDFDQKSRDYAASVGLSNDRMYMLRQNIIQAGIDMNHYGVSIEDALTAQSSYTDELGRSVILSQDALINMSRVGKATGLGVQAVAELAGEMEAFGLGAETATQFIGEMYSETAAMGLNSGKVIKNFQQNLSLLNQLSFKNGRNGLKEMAKLSTRLKLDMQSVASSAEKLSKLEDAVEAAANLQVLGGELAALGDPFQLMYKARNAPEELMKSITKAAKASAVWNDQTKEFEVSAYELDRLRQAATALNMDYSKLVETAKQGAKLEKFEGLLSGKGLSKEDKEAIATMSEMKDGKAQIQIGTDSKGKAIFRELSQLGKDDFKKILQDKKNMEEAAAQATGLQEKWQNMLNQFSIVAYPLIEALIKDLKPTIDKLSVWAKDVAKSIMGFFTMMANNPFILGLLKWGLIVVALGKLLGPFLSIAWWFAKGVAMGNGFNVATSKGTLTKTLMGKITGAGAGAGSGVISGAAGGGLSMKDKLKQIQAMKAKDPTLGSQEALKRIRAAEQAKQMNQMSSSTSKLGAASRVSAGQILALGAALLMVGGAIYLAATGLAKLVEAFKGLTGPQAFGAVAAIVAVMGGFVAIIYAMVPAIAALGAVGSAVAIPLLALGAAFFLIGAGIGVAALGLSVLVNSFTAMFAVIGENGSSALLAGLGFLAMAAGIYVLTSALIAMSAASLISIPGFLMLTGISALMVGTATALSSAGGGDGIAKTIDAINRVDIDKLEALKSLTTWMALLGSSTTIKFDENLKVGGEIILRSDGSAERIDLTDPTIQSQIVEIVFNRQANTKNGGTA